MGRVQHLAPPLDPGVWFRRRDWLWSLKVRCAGGSGLSGRMWGSW